MRGFRDPRTLVVMALLLATALVPTQALAGEADTGHAPQGAAMRALADVAALPGAIDLRDRRPSAPSAAFGVTPSGDEVRLLVGLPEVFAPHARLAATELARQRAQLASAEQDLLRELGPTVRSHRSLNGFVPHVEITVRRADVDRVVAATGAATVEPVGWSSAALEQTAPLVGATTAAQLGFDGSGTTVAIVDTGVDSSHEFLAGRVVAEACFSSQASCPNGATSQVSSGAGRPCTYAPSACEHGTHVAGIAAGRGAGWSGVAPGAGIAAVQVFSRFDGTTCAQARATSPCALASTTDQIAALGYLADLAADLNLAAVNLSIGSDDEIGSACDSQQTAYASAIAQLEALGVAVVISSGNAGHDAGVGFPACLSRAVTVGNSTKADTIAASSNHAGLVDLLAPGSEIVSSTPGNAYKAFTGTSMAAPHVAGAFALLRQREPDAGPVELLGVLAGTGVGIGDARNSVIRPRIQVDAALLALAGDREAEGNPVPDGGLCPTDDWREVGDEQSYAVVNGRTEYGVICSGNDDWFAFPGGAGSSVDVQLRFDHASGDLDLQLWNASSALMISESSTDDEALSGTINTSDTYFVRVYGFEGSENDYELTVTYTSCPPDDLYEPNDEVGEATELGGTTFLFGEACSGDLDIYQVDLAVGESIAAEAFFLHRFGDVDVRLYDPNLALVSASVSVDDDEYVNYTAAVAGPHYVTVEGFAGAENSYTLSVTAGELCPTNDPYEPNDDQLTPMAPGQLLSGVACSDEIDFFGVDLVAGMTLDATLLFAHFNGDLDLYVYNPRGGLVASADSVTDNEFATVSIDENGTWILGVTGFAGARNAYQLLLDATIGNDDRASAEPLSTGAGRLESTTVSATTEAGEPQHAGVPNSGSVWYRWTVPTAGLAVLHTHGSDIDTVLAVYREAGDGSLVEVAANDDVSGLLTSHSGHFEVVAGEELFVAVDAYAGVPAAEQGRFELHWRIDDAATAAGDPDGVGADPGAVAWDTPLQRRVVETCDDRQDTGFSDVPASNVHEYAVRCIAGYGITLGRDDGTYNPSGSLTFGQTATFLVRTLQAGGSPAPEADGSCGDDNRTHIESVERLVAAGVLSPADCQRHNDVILRGQMSQMVHDALVVWAGIIAPAQTGDRDYYSDDDGHDREAAIDGITALGIVTGRGDGTFGPETTLTRAQMGTFLARCIDALQDRSR